MCISLDHCSHSGDHMLSFKNSLGYCSVHERERVCVCVPVHSHAHLLLTISVCT